MYVSSLCRSVFQRESHKSTNTRMYILLALLCVALMAPPECASLPTRENITRHLNNIISIAQTTLIHIKTLRTKLPVAPQIEVTTPPIVGLTDITRDLGLLDNDLQSSGSELLSQIQTDVSSLEGKVRFLALTMNCPVPARPGVQTGHSSFPDSHLYLILTKVQRYLESLSLNKDKLKVC
ncbi:leptin b [Stegastes partitus]|uniref:Leptin-B-like n=2 Tax=Stegastes partitus TaxID=144197 RepID=A0A9Y4JP68_9TELE|nr:PREDICTED: leptin-B-like [Stegastes partitus]XP_008277082.1 PREDICTED: leptin-B-like [Stegastes partitus]